MSDTILYIEISYENKTNEFNFKTNVKREKLVDFLDNYLRTTIGKGEDKSDINKVDMFNIRIELDLNGDVFSITDNCGNKGLRDGIILYFKSQLIDKKEDS